MIASRSYWVRDSDGMATALINVAHGARRTFIHPTLATKHFGLQITREQAAHSLVTARKNGADIGVTTTTL